MSVLGDIARKEHKMEMTPMIDVTFLLLIFFLLTLRFKTLEGKLAAYLPKDIGVNTTEAEPREKVEITLRVKQVGDKRDPGDMRMEWSGEGRFEFLPGTRIIEYSIGPKRTQSLDELETRLKRLYKLDKERPATIDSRPGTVYGDVVRVLDAAIEVGYRDITFVGEYK